MTINGTYVHEKNENLEALLKALGVSEERVKKLSSAKPQVEINLTGNKLTKKTSVGENKIENVINVGSPSVYKIGGAIEIDVNLNISGNIAKGTLTKGSHTGELVVEFGETHLTETYKLGEITSKRIYKRT